MGNNVGVVPASSPAERDSSAVVASGTVIGDRYRLIGLVGHGGMGQVWRAQDQVLAREVAVKVLHAPYAADHDFRVRFRGEAQAAASVSHANVVSVFDYGEQTTSAGQRVAYLVMELLPGRSLANVLGERSTLPAAEVHRIVEQVACGLAAIHAKGLVHRDLKPANLLLAADNTVKIADFGIARAADAVSLTRTGTVIGTAHYMSPEQALGQRATAASDLYSLGVVAYRALAGAPPFHTGGPVAVARAHVSDPPPPLPATTPPSLRQLVTELLAKDPAARPQSALAVAAVAAGEGTLDRPGADATEPLLTEPLPTETQVWDPAAAARPGRADENGWGEAIPLPPAGLAGVPGGYGAIDAPLVAGTAPTKRYRRITTLCTDRSPGARRTIGLLAALVLLVVAVVALAESGPSTATVPQLTGRSLSSAETALARNHLNARVTYTDAPDRAAGTVLAQNPGPGTKIKRGALVALRVANGKVAVDAAIYVGRPYPQVQAEIDALGLHPTETTVATSSQAAGDVIALSPSGQVPVGSTITITVATAPPTTTTTTTTTTAPATTQAKPGPTGPKQAPASGPAKHAGH